MNTNTAPTFTLNGHTYMTDSQTVKLLRKLIPAARQSGDSSAVQAVMTYGQRTGRIVELDDYAVGAAGIGE
jgi:hypothetical protein